MTFIPLPTPGYINAAATVSTDGFQQILVFGPNKVGYWFFSYYADLGQSSGGVTTIRWDLDGVGNFYNGSADEDSGSMYVHHMGMSYFYNGALGPSNYFRCYVDKAGRSPFTINIFLTFIPSQSYPH